MYVSQVRAHECGYPVKPEALGQLELETEAIVSCLMWVLGIYKSCAHFELLSTHF